MRWLLTAAALLAAGMIAAGIVAGTTLRERDAAVREGVLIRTAHQLESELRDRGPDDLERFLAAFLGEHPEASAVEIAAEGRTLGRAGTPQGSVVESPAALGPAWRGIAGAGMHGMGRGRSPYTLRLWPGSGIGDSSWIATTTMAGSIIAGLSLLLFAVTAARGLEAQRRAEALDAQRRRLETVATAGAGLAHRIRNPLATIKGTAQVLEPQLEVEAQRERVRRIVDASVRIETLVDELLGFARPVEPRPETFDLAGVVREAAEGCRIAAGPAVRVRADREHVLAAVEELVANAKAFDASGPEITVARRGRSGVVEVADRGPGLGIEPARAFDPYVTTRADGSGLGLPTIDALMRASGGEVRIANRQGGGCVATILLPLEEPE